MATKEQTPDDAQIGAQLDEAKSLIDQREYRRALQLLDPLKSATPAGSPHHARHRHHTGLALARMGAMKAALKLFDELDLGEADSELIGLYGRLHMDRYDREGRVEDLRKSQEVYDAGYRKYRRDCGLARRKWEKTGDADDRNEWIETAGKAFYLGINVAAKGVFLGDPRAPTVARQVQKLVAELPEDAYDYWAVATDAEASLIQGNLDEAARRYTEAVTLSTGDRGSHASSWLQARRLMNAMNVSYADSGKVWSAFRHLTDEEPGPGMSTPPHRRLRVYAFDPSLARRLETAGVNEVTLNVPWESLEWPKPKLDKDGNQERDEDGDPVFDDMPGPIGEYLEIVDFDPASRCFYEPVNLDDPGLLAMDGLAPSEGDPRFHQQMVYAVAMNVIDHFERALGRKALWSPRSRSGRGQGNPEATFVRRLRVYPHALREANAYYSPSKKALLFGYFEADTDDPAIVPEARIFTSLSHDVVAHEMSHALLDGLHPRFAEATNVDVLALHEAFADVVALFQHFSHPGVLRHEIGRTRGDLATEGMLGQLAQQFGRAIGRYGALRSALGGVDEKTGEWRPSKPDPDALKTTREPHARGAVLVAAIFDAFLTIYDARTRDLLRIATQGSGVLEPGALHPDLVERLAREASKAATHLLRMCIRALDYCPPVDITFGDYLRALITADVDMVPDDRLRYRVAIIEAFQRRGIYPHDVRNLSVESLVWRPPRGKELDIKELFDSGSRRPLLSAEWRPQSDRKELWMTMHRSIQVVDRWLRDFATPEAADELGLVLSTMAPRSVVRRGRRPGVEVTSVRAARRSTPSGGLVTDLVVEILQERLGYDDPDVQRRVDEGKLERLPEADFVFRGGCTLLIDPGTFKARYAITKHILSEGRLQSQRSYVKSVRPLSAAAYFADPYAGEDRKEPFALLHGMGG